MSFTDQKQHITTEEDIKARWGCRKPGELFRCAVCGYKFKIGDIYRWIFTNFKGSEIPGNPFVCGNCDGTNEEVIVKLTKMRHEFNRFWWFQKSSYKME